MGLIVEDGSGKADADALVDQTFADAYFADHGAPADWTAAAPEAKEAAIRYATIWVCEFGEYRGAIASRAQALAFPRAGMVDAHGRSIESTVIPVRIKQAVCERARAHLSDPIDGFPEDGLEAVDLDGLAVDFAAAGVGYRYIESLLAPYLTTGATGSVRSIRA